MFCPSCPLQGRKEPVCPCEMGREIGNPAAEKRTGFIKQRQSASGKSRGPAAGLPRPSRAGHVPSSLLASGGPQMLAQHPHRGMRPWGSRPLHHPTHATIALGEQPTMHSPARLPRGPIKPLSPPAGWPVLQCTRTALLGHCCQVCLSLDLSHLPVLM